MFLWLPFLLLSPLVTGQVSIELPGASEEARDRIEQACNRALGEGRCVAASQPLPAPTPAQAAADAEGHPRTVRVLWASDGRRARLIFLGGSDTPPRELSFSEQDPMPARWEAVGLVIAAYVLADGRRTTPAATSEPPPPSTPAPSAPPSSPDPPRWAADLRLAVGPGLDRGAARFGLGLQGALRPWPAPILLLGQLEAAKRFEAPDVRFWSGGVGLGLWLPMPAPRLSLQLDLTAVAEHVEVSAIDPSSGLRDDGSQLRWGGRLAAALVACVSERVCVLGGARISALSPAVRVEILGTPAGRLDAVGFDALIGVRITDP